MASGAVSVGAAKVFGSVLLVTSVALGFAVARALGITVLAYAVLTVLYSLRLKHEPVLDLATVAAGFVLRAVGGGAACDVRISTWFLIVAAAGSLFIVTGKRSAEVSLVGAGTAGTRKALAGYTAEYLRFVRSVAPPPPRTRCAQWRAAGSRCASAPRPRPPTLSYGRGCAAVKQH